MLRSLIAAAALTSCLAVEPQVDRGQVLVYKQLSAPETQDFLVVGKPFVVTFFVFNMGSCAAAPRRQRGNPRRVLQPPRRGRAPRNARCSARAGVPLSWACPIAGPLASPRPPRPLPPPLHPTPLAGKGDALNVKVKDTFPTESFEFVSGETEKTWATLARCVPRRGRGGLPCEVGVVDRAPGRQRSSPPHSHASTTPTRPTCSGANETFSVTLKPKTAGTLKPARAQVDYQYVAEGEDETVDVTAFSTSPGPLTIVTLAAYSRYTATFTTELAVAAAAAAFAIFFPARMYRAAKAANGGKKRA